MRHSRVHSQADSARQSRFSTAIRKVTLCRITTRRDTSDKLSGRESVDSDRGHVIMQQRQRTGDEVLYRYRDRMSRASVALASTPASPVKRSSSKLFAKVASLLSVGSPRTTPNEVVEAAPTNTDGVLHPPSPPKKPQPPTPTSLPSPPAIFRQGSCLVSAEDTSREKPAALATPPAMDSVSPWWFLSGGHIGTERGNGEEASASKEQPPPPLGSSRSSTLLARAFHAASKAVSSAKGWSQRAGDEAEAPQPLIRAESNTAKWMRDTLDTYPMRGSVACPIATVSALETSTTGAACGESGLSRPSRPVPVPMISPAAGSDDDMNGDDAASDDAQASQALALLKLLSAAQLHKLGRALRSELGAEKLCSLRGPLVDEAGCDDGAAVDSRESNVSVVDDLPDKHELGGQRCFPAAFRREVSANI